MRPCVNKYLAAHRLRISHKIPIQQMFRFVINQISNKICSSITSETESDVAIFPVRVAILDIILLRATKLSDRSGQISLDGFGAARKFERVLRRIHVD